MRASLRVELKRAYCNYGFLFSVGLGSMLAVMAFFNTAGWKLSKYWLRYMHGESEALAKAAAMGFVDTPLEIWMPRYGASSKFYYLWITILPLLCVMPYGVTYLLDKKHGLINQLIYRMGKKNYYFSKFISCFLSGGTIAVVPLMVNLILCMCFLPWGIPIRSTNVYPVGQSNAFSEIFYSSPLLYVIIYLGFTFILFGLINCMCLILALVEDNQFALMITPFAVYFAQHVLFSFGISKGELSLMRNASLYNVYGNTIYFYIIELVILFAVDFCIMVKCWKDVL